MKKPYPQLQKHKWAPMLALNLMVLEDTMMGSRCLIKYESDFICTTYGGGPQAHTTMDLKELIMGLRGFLVPCSLKNSLKLSFLNHGFSELGFFDIQFLNSNFLGVEIHLVWIHDSSFLKIN